MTRQPDTAGKPRPQAATALCAVDDIPDGGCNGFFIDSADGRLLYMAIRRGTDVYVYVNRCPHTGMPLDFQPGEFLSADRTLIQCSSHGAQFRIEDGFCVSGPCEGDHLTAVDTAIREGRVYIVAVNTPTTPNHAL
jgi:nitrite reductase/ring-hydroxylating ferredoxin subunit